MNSAEAQHSSSNQSAPFSLGCRNASEANPLEKLRESIGGLLLTDDNTRVEYSKTTLPVGTIPLGIARPQNQHELVKVVRAAKRCGVAVHPISRGKNWGYGDSCASENGALIIDLRSMNRIVEINENLGFAVIEPGVTQADLASELEKRGSGLMLDVTGAGPDASIVGNILQRGFGHTPYGDRTANSCNYHGVDLDGNAFSTGFGHIEKSSVGHVYPYGVGPSRQWEFAQSNQFIITRMTIWLMPRPASVEGFGFSTDSGDAFAEIVNRLAKLRQAGVIDSVVHLANDLRVVSSQDWLDQYGEQEGPFSSDQRKLFRRRAGIGVWNGLGGVYGTRGIVRAKKREIVQALRGTTKVRFFDAHKLKLLHWAAKTFPGMERLRNLSSSVSDVFELLNGRPSKNHLQGAFYRKRPDSGQVIDAGLIWVAPVIPFAGTDASRLVALLEPIANSYGFDLPLTISPVVPRAAVCISNISFDKKNEEASRCAKECYRAMAAALDRIGFPRYRRASVQI